MSACGGLHAGQGPWTTDRHRLQILDLVMRSIHGQGAAGRMRMDSRSSSIAAVVFSMNLVRAFRRMLFDATRAITIATIAHGIAALN